MFDPPAPKGAVSRWEHGGGPNKSRLRKIAKLGNVTVDYLLGLTDYPNVDNIDIGFTDDEKTILQDNQVKAFEYLSQKRHFNIENISDKDKALYWEFLQSYQWLLGLALMHNKLKSLDAVEGIVKTLSKIISSEAIGKVKSLTLDDAVNDINDLTRQLNKKFNSKQGYTFTPKQKRNHKK